MPDEPQVDVTVTPAAVTVQVVPDVAAHTQEVRVDAVELIDAHPPRTESPLFHRNRALLMARIGKCWVDNEECDTAHLEAHHIAEWSQADKYDFARLHDALLALDPYGYSHQSAGQPITSVDDVRNLIILCHPHHMGRAGLGVHFCTFPELVEMKARKAGTAITQAELTAEGATHA